MEGKETGLELGISKKKYNEEGKEQGGENREARSRVTLMRARGRPVGGGAMKNVS